MQGSDCDDGVLSGCGFGCSMTNRTAYQAHRYSCSAGYSFRKDGQLVMYTGEKPFRLRTGVTNYLPVLHNEMDDDVHGKDDQPRLCTISRVKLCL